MSKGKTNNIELANELSRCHFTRQESIMVEGVIFRLPKMMLPNALIFA